MKKCYHNIKYNFIHLYSDNCFHTLNKTKFVSVMKLYHPYTIIEY